MSFPADLLKICLSDDYFSHCSQISSWQTLQNTFDVFVLFIFFLTNKEHIKNSSFLIFFFLNKGTFWRQTCFFYTLNTLSNKAALKAC